MCGIESPWPPCAGSCQGPALLHSSRVQILVIGFNPAVDVEWRVESVHWDEKNTVLGERRWAGGKLLDERVECDADARVVRHVLAECQPPVHAHALQHRIPLHLAHHQRGVAGLQGHDAERDVLQYLHEDPAEAERTPRILVVEDNPTGMMVLKHALKNALIPVVTNLPALVDTAIVLGQAARSGGRLAVVSQFEQPGGPDQYGAIIPKGSKNAGAINAVLKQFEQGNQLLRLEKGKIMPSEQLPQHIEATLSLVLISQEQKWLAM